MINANPADETIPVNAPMKVPNSIAGMLSLNFLFAYMGTARATVAGPTRKLRISPPTL